MWPLFWMSQNFPTCPIYMKMLHSNTVTIAISRQNTQLAGAGLVSSYCLQWQQLSHCTDEFYQLVSYIAIKNGTCFTLEQLVQTYLLSGGDNLTLSFLPGDHMLSEQLLIGDFKEVLIVGQNSTKKFNETRRIYPTAENWVSKVCISLEQVVKLLYACTVFEKY